MVGMSDIKTELDRLPNQPGVYIFKDSEDRILYVGKAANLQKRVKSYFYSKRHSVKTEVLVSKIKKIDFFCTNTEKEALLLEASLIKKHRPRFNVVLRDDKNYLLFKIDKTHEYPAIYLTRKVEKDGCVYFGPFVSAKSARETLKAINRIFPIRKCKDTVFRNRVRPCLQYYIKRCLAPCVFEVDKKKYAKIVKDLELFLSGRSKELIKKLEEEMWKASDSMEFEKAAILRDQIMAIKATLERQSVVDPEGKDKDVIVMQKDENFIFVCVLFIRQGKLLDYKLFKLDNPATLDDTEIFKSFLFQFYSPSKFIPEEIITPLSLDEALLEEILSEWKGERVKVKGPTSLKDKDLVVLAYKNLVKEKEKIKEVNFDCFHFILNNNVPKRIEAVDVSHIGGIGVLVGQIVFEDGQLKKDDYRIYKINNLKTNYDDYEALREWARRRVKSGPPWPDLVVVDGGKGQLKAVYEEFKKMDLNLPVIAIAKPSDKERDDKIYFYKDKFIKLENFEGLRFLQFLRDNVHRFVLSRQRRLRKRDLVSELEKLKGIGPKIATLLWTNFKSLEKILDLNEKDLTNLPGIGEKKAKLIYSSLKELKKELEKEKNKTFVI